MAPIKTGKRSYLIYSRCAIHRLHRWFEIRAKLDLRKWERLENDWIVAGELGNVLEKVLRDFDKLFPKIGTVWLNEGCVILREDVVGRSRVRWSEEQVKPVGLILKFSEVLRFDRYGEDHKRIDFTMDVIYLESLPRLYSVLGAPVTARAREFCSKLLETRYLFLQ